MNIRFSGMSSPFFSTPAVNVRFAGQADTTASDDVTSKDSVDIAVSVDRIAELLEEAFADLEPEAGLDFLISPNTAALLADLVNGGDDKNQALPLATLSNTVFPAFKKDEQIKGSLAISGFDVIRVLRELASNSILVDSHRKEAFLARLNQKEEKLAIFFQKAVLAATKTALSQNDMLPEKETILSALEALMMGEPIKEDIASALQQQGYDPLTVDQQLVPATIELLGRLQPGK